jgi:hypothetical protein
VATTATATRAVAVFRSPLALLTDLRRDVCVRGFASFLPFAKVFLPLEGLGVQT